MTNRVLLGLDLIFCFYGTFWAGALVVAALPRNFDFSQGLLLFSVILIFIFPLIRKFVEILSKMSWEDFKYAFKEKYENRAKKRWEY